MGHGPEILDHLPLKNVEFFVLAILQKQPLHGYGLVKEIQEQSQGSVDLKPGNLYRVLDRLLQQGLVRESEAPARDVDGRRQYYDLTPLGQRVLRAEAGMLSSFVQRVLTAEGGAE